MLIFLLFRPNCFQVVLRALTESRMFYLCADTQDLANVSSTKKYQTGVMCDCYEKSLYWYFWGSGFTHYKNKNKQEAH